MIGCSIALFIETIRTDWFIVSYNADLLFSSLGNKFGRSPYLMNSLFSTFFFWTPPTYINILNLTYLIPCLVCLSYGWPAIGSRRTSSDYSSYLQNKYKDVAALKSELFWDFKMLQWWLKIKLIPLEAIWLCSLLLEYQSTRLILRTRNSGQFSSLTRTSPTLTFIKNLNWNDHARSLVANGVVANLV